MDENKLKFGVGVLVISAIGIGIILTFLFGAFPSVLQRDYTLSVVFPSAEGIGPNTPVLRDGVRIGRVRDIELRGEGGVLVTLAMDATQRLDHNYLPRVGSGNFVTGDAKLEFVRATQTRLTSLFGDDQSIVDSPYSDGEYVEYGTRTESFLDMQDEVTETFTAIQTAGESIARAGESVTQLAAQVREIVDGTDEKVDSVADEAVLALQEFQGAMQDVRAILGDEEMRANLQQSLADLPELLGDVRTALASTRETFETFERVGDQFEKVGVAAEETVKTVGTTIDGARATFDNLAEFTEPFADRGDELAEQVGQTLANLDTTLSQVSRFASALNNNQGSLKRFLEDDDIYFEIRRTVQNIEQASARIRPILDDVRIFSDKIARDPRELGVRGAIGKRPSGAGYK